MEEKDLCKECEGVLVGPETHVTVIGSNGLAEQRLLACSKCGVFHNTLGNISDFQGRIRFC